MKNLIKNSFVIALAASGMFMMNSCKKTEVEDITKKQSNAAVYEKLPQMQVKSLSQTVELQSLVFGILKVKGSTFRLAEEEFNFGGCATVTKDTSALPYTVHVDMGPSGCIGSDGKLYTGSIDLEYNSNDMGIPGSYFHATFNNVSIDNDLQINGSLNLENFGLNGSGNLHGKLDVNMTTTFKALEIELNGTNTFFLEAANEPNETITALTGGGNGYTDQGFSYTQTITQPLIFGSCEYIVEGIIKLESPSFDTKFVDYGDGTCDNIAYVIQGANRGFITLEN